MEEKLKATIKSKDYSDLEEKFRYIVSKYEGSVYIPNPYLSHNPKFIFIGMEPSIKANNFESFKIEYLTSFKNLIIHYCAYSSLCDHNFNYHLTDVSKLAMSSDKANKKNVRIEIYKKFYPLLIEEIEVLNNPTIITTITTAKMYLLKENFNILENNIVLHWGNNNFARKRFDTKLEELGFNDPFIEYNELSTIIKSFAFKLMNYLSFDSKAIEERFRIIFDKQYSDYEKHNLAKLYHYYMLKFENIKNFKANSTNL